MSVADYTFALLVARHRLLIAGDAMPVETEVVDIHVLAALARGLR